MSREASNALKSARKQQILEIAGRLFARNGYRGTSIREIGEQAGILGGSLYHHIKSKDALFVELHNHALDTAEKTVATAIASHRDPWARLTAACITLLEIQLAPDSITQPLMNDFREVPEEVRQQLVKRRDDFENVFRKMIENLPLPPEIDRSVYRITLLSLLNTTENWYRPGGMSPAEVATQIVRIFRHDCAQEIGVAKDENVDEPNRVD